MAEGGLREVTIRMSGPVNLEATLECGQAFRWKKARFARRPDLRIAYRGVIGSLAVVLGQDERVTSDIVAGWEGAPHTGGAAVEALVKRYLSDGDDIESIENSLSLGGGVMSLAVEHGRGLRILSQDPWESLGSYVLSLNKNISSISASIEYLAGCYGEVAGMGLFTFPSPGAIAGQEVASLRRSRCGFRDKYLHDAATKVSSGELDLQAVGSMPTPEARYELMKVAGVGPKVADCVLLFGYHRLDVFPVDVWIARAVSRYFLGGRLVKPREAREEGERRFGPLAGYAQEYLFYWMRNEAQS